MRTTGNLFDNNKIIRSEGKAIPVSEYIELLNGGLKAFSARVVGEVGEVKLGPTGHVYFSLKDERDGSVLKCIIWKSQYLLYGVKLEEGVKIIATGYPEIYPKTGRISFIADVIEYEGEGRLKKEYENLKEKLEKEGLFSEGRKREIPKYPQVVGLITSRQGAVLEDFLSNLTKHGFKIKLIDSRVEGQSAVGDLISAIRQFKREKIDVLVIMRGGGSLEAMMAFNNEILVREVANFPVPVIAAIGHHKDVPLISLAADLSVSTPSIAATTLSQGWKEAQFLLKEYEESILSNFLENLKEKKEKMKSFKEIIIQFEEKAKSSYKTIIEKLTFHFQSLIKRSKDYLFYVEKIIRENDPQKHLRLGYSIVFLKERVVRKVEDVKIGDTLKLVVSNGNIFSKVKGKERNGEKEEKEKKFR